MNVRRFALIAAAVLAVAPIAACGASDDTKAAAAGSGTCPNGEIRFGVEPFEDPGKLTPAAKALGAALEKKLNCPVKVQITEDYSAEVLAMQNGKLDVAMFGPLGYVFANKRAKAEAVASFADATGKLSTYTAGIWVPQASPINAIADLRGHSLALSSVGSTSGDGLPRKALKDAGIEQKDLKINYAGGHPQSLLALVKGAVDAAEINSQQLATATAAGTFDKARFRQIWTSDPIPNDPITVRGDLDPTVKSALKDALLHLDAASVAEIGKLLDVDPPGPLAAVDQSTYQPLFDLATTLGLTEKDV